ncbi:MAG: hypothetical protein ABSF49_06440 [Roseiarcus sp.]
MKRAAKLCRQPTVERAMRTNVVVVPAPGLAFSCVVTAEQAVGVQALPAEFAVEPLDVGVAGRLFRPGDVERDAGA